MRRIAILAPVLAVFLLSTALAEGIAHGQMLRGDMLAWLDVCAEEEGAEAPCLDCSLAAGMAVGAANAFPGAAPVARHPRGGPLVATSADVAGGGARAPPKWI